MLKIDVAKTFIFQVDGFKEETNGKLISSIDEGRVALGALFDNKLDNILGTN